MTGNRGFRTLPQRSLSVLTPQMLVLAMWSLTAGCLAQEQPAETPPLPSAPSAQKTTRPEGDLRVIIPIGTLIPLVLTRPLNSHDIHSGDFVFAQVSNPVMVNDQVAIPAGTFVRGKVAHLRRNGTRGELTMHSAALVMGAAVVDLGGPVRIESEEWTAYSNPSGAAKAAIILVPMLAMPVGALLGHAADGKTTTYLGGTPFTTPSHKGLVIGTTVGFGVGVGAALALLAHSHGFYLEEGTPLHMTLASSVSLTRAQIAAAEQNPAPVQVIRKTRPWPGPGTNPPIAFPGNSGSGPASCSAGDDWCLGSCKSSIDFTSDSSNCGRCGNRCSFNESCTGGFCSCAAGYSSCMGQCVSSSSFISDNSNCGSCGHSCSIGESCTGGMCMKQP